MPPPKIASHSRVRSAASDPTDGERLGKIYNQGVPHHVWVLGVEGECHYHDRNGVGDLRRAET